MTDPTRQTVRNQYSGLLAPIGDKSCQRQGLGEHLMLDAMAKVLSGVQRTFRDMAAVHRREE